MKIVLRYILFIFFLVMAVKPALSQQDLLNLVPTENLKKNMYRMPLNPHAS